MGVPANSGYGTDGQCDVKNNVIYSNGKTANGYTKVPFDDSPLIKSQAKNNICLSGQSCGTNSTVHSGSMLSSRDSQSAQCLMPAQALTFGKNLYSSGVTEDYMLAARKSSTTFDLGAVAFQSRQRLSAPKALRVL